VTPDFSRVSEKEGEGELKKAVIERRAWGKKNHYPIFPLKGSKSRKQGGKERRGGQKKGGIFYGLRS